MQLDSPITIRPATTGHIPDIISLERRCLTAAHWSEQRYQELFREEKEALIGRMVLVVEQASSSGQRGSGGEPGTELIGFLVARHVDTEWEVENIVVAPEARLKGIGTRLLEELMARAKQMNSDRVFLEVRDSNAAARALYEKFGFQETRRRQLYYENPCEDAVLYCKDLATGGISE